MMVRVRPVGAGGNCSPGFGVFHLSVSHNARWPARRNRGRRQSLLEFNRREASSWVNACSLIQHQGGTPSQPARMAASITSMEYGLSIDVTCATCLRRETFVDSQWGGGLKAGLQRDIGMDAFFSSSFSGLIRIKAGKPRTLGSPKPGHPRKFAPGRPGVKSEVNE